MGTVKQMVLDEILMANALGTDIKGGLPAEIKFPNANQLDVFTVGSPLLLAVLSACIQVSYN